MSAASDLFPHLIEHLLGGEVICEYSSESEYRYLQDKTRQEDVDQFLRRMNRCLRQTGDKVAFYAAYTTLENPDYRAASRSQFEEVINNLEPLVRWLNLTTTIKHTDRPVIPGDLIKGSQLLEAIENTNVLCEELSLLSRSKMFKNTQSTPKGQLEAVLKRLSDQGYLIPIGRSGSQYTASGKWSRLYDLMAFISTHEQLDVEDPEADQAEMPL